jgi:hypothetical protein
LTVDKESEMNVIPAGILLHIPDGFLNVLVSAVCWLLTVVILAIAVANTRRDLDERLVPLAGVMAAFIFAARCSTFPSPAARRATSSARRWRSSSWGRGWGCWP